MITSTQPHDEGAVASLQVQTSHGTYIRNVRRDADIYGGPAGYLDTEDNYVWIWRQLRGVVRFLQVPYDARHTRPGDSEFYAKGLKVAFGIRCTVFTSQGSAAEERAMATYGHPDCAQAVHAGVRPADSSNPVYFVHETGTRTWHIARDAQGQTVRCGQTITGAPLVFRRRDLDRLPRGVHGCIDCATQMIHLVAGLTSIRDSVNVGPALTVASKTEGAYPPYGKPVDADYVEDDELDEEEAGIPTSWSSTWDG